MGAFDLGWQTGANEAAARASRDEANRIAARDSQASLIENALNNPNTSQADRQQLLQQHMALFQPHEAPTLFARLGGLIHGQAKAAAGQGDTSTSPAPVSSQAPVIPGQKNELGDQITPSAPVNELGAPLPTAATAAIPNADDSTPHPFSNAPHPLLSKLSEGLASLGDHLKGFAQPVAPSQVSTEPTADLIARTYASPESIKREDIQTAATNALNLAKARANYGNTEQGRYISAFATDRGKTSSELTPEERLQATKEYNDARRAPQRLVDPTTGVVNIVTWDEDGNPVASPMMDANGHAFGGFKPNTVTVRQGVYHFIDSNNQMREVPVTTSTTRIFGPHAQGDESGAKPIVMPKPDPEAQAPVIQPASAAPPVTPMPIPKASVTSPVASASPASLASLTALANTVNSRRTQATPTHAPKTPTSSNAPVYPGRTIGDARLPVADRGVLEADQQVQDSIKQVLPSLEAIKDKNGLLDRAQMEYAWQQYKHGIEPSDPNIANVIRNIALLQTQGAAPWIRIGRSKYTFDVIQKHLPAPSDTPKMMFDKVMWMKDNVIPASVRATKSGGMNATSGDEPTPKIRKFNQTTGRLE